jgi:hypothetical protein
VATMPLTARVRLWRTPDAPGTTGGPRTHTSQGHGHQVTLEEQARTGPGSLNPRWVETLMGVPIGWTLPSCTQPSIPAPTNCASSATESSPPSQPSPFSLCGVS